MAPLAPNFSNDVHSDPQPAFLNHLRSKSASEIQREEREEEREEARVIFNKTLEGQYRHGKTGYRRVGALFLTWEDDDMGCKQQEVNTLEGLVLAQELNSGFQVDKLGKLFESEFHFNTEYFEIPSECWETALHCRVADFCHKYNSPQDLAIVYYGGHAYEGQETKEFKLAAKFQRDGNGDPTAFFGDIRTCLRLPRCDQLMILDCCYSARAFTHEHIGKRKFELLTSAAHNLTSPAPKFPHSFTRALYDTMIRLLKENPKGFCTSHLYREVYHTIPDATNPKPLLFDQARHSFGRIWLRPQVQFDRPPKAADEGRYLKLTFRLNEKPDLAVMNELALHLQYLPHVDQVRFDDLYAPKEQIANFMNTVVQASKLKPLIRKIHARRQLRKVAGLTGQKREETPSSLIKLHLEQTAHSAYDWSDTRRDHAYSPIDSQQAQDGIRKSGTWPPIQGKALSNGSLSNGSSSNGGPAASSESNPISGEGRYKRPRSVSPDWGSRPAKARKVDHWKTSSDNFITA